MNRGLSVVVLHIRPLVAAWFLLALPCLAQPSSKIPREVSLEELIKHAAAYDGELVRVSAEHSPEDRRLHYLSPAPPFRAIPAHSTALFPTVDFNPNKTRREIWKNPVDTLFGAPRVYLYASSDHPGIAELLGNQRTIDADFIGYFHQVPTNAADSTRSLWELELTDVRVHYSYPSYGY